MILGLRFCDSCVAIGLALLTIFLGSQVMLPGVSGIYHDDGVYISTAKALAGAKGYHLINLPDSPPQTKYPIIYPAMLAVIWKLWPAFPANLAAMKWLTLTLSGLSLGLSYLYLVTWNYTGRPVAFLAAALVASSPCYLYYGSLVLSEMPFAFFTILAFMALELYLDVPRSSPARQYLLGMLLALPFLTRAIGIVLLPVALSLVLWRRRPIFWLSLGLAVAVLPWLFWAILAPNWHNSPVTAYYTNYFSWWHSSMGSGSWLSVLLMNFYLICFSLVYTGLAVLSVADWAMIWPLGLCLIGLIPLTNIVYKLGQRPVLPAFLLSYFFITLVWPWPPSRFLIPFLPLLWAFLFDGLQGLSTRFLVLRHRYLPVVLLGSLLFISNLTGLYLVAQKQQQSGYPAVTLAQDYPPWSAYQEIFAWISKNTQPSDIIASGMDTMIYLYTGRQSFRPFVGHPYSLFYGAAGPGLGSMEEMIGFIKLNKARFLVQTPMPMFMEEKPMAEFVEDLQRRCPDWLRPVYLGKDKRFVVFELVPDREPD